MTTAKIILDETRRTKNGFPIKIYLYNVKKKLISLNLYSEKKDWNGYNVKKSHPDYRRLSEIIRKRQDRLEEEIDHCNSNRLNFADALEVVQKGISPESEIESLKKRIKKLERESGAMLFEFWETFVSEKRAEGKSIKHFKGTKDQILKYTKGDIPINDIDYEWLKGFINFKYSEGCNDGGISHYLRTLRSVYLEAQRRESLNVKPGNPFKGLIRSGKKKEIVELTKEDFERLRAWEPSRFANSIARESALRRRDVFLFQIHVGGHDFVDISLLDHGNIKKGRVRFDRYKNRNKEGIYVDNMLTKEAKEIINRWGSDDGRIFDFIPCPINEPDRYIKYRENTNRLFRKISENLKLSHILKTKSPRYIFGTWSAETKADIASIMQIQGHKPKSVAFTYKGRISKEVQDQEHIKVLG